MSCREFRDQLAKLVSDRSDVESHPHLQTRWFLRRFIFAILFFNAKASSALLNPRENEDG
jgi:hypothetical protein